MEEETGKYPLLRAAIMSFRLPWHWVTVIVAALLVVSFILAVLLDGALHNISRWEFWRGFLGPSTIIVYVLAIYPFMHGLWERAIRAFQLILIRGEDIEISYVSNRRWKWIAIFVGVAFWLGMERPWIWISQWLDVYSSITNMLMFSLLSWLVFNGIASSRQLNRLSRKPLNIDIFNSGLIPVARYSMGVTFAFIGGISLSLVFQSVESLLTWQSITTYSILVSVTVLLFFLSMWSTHGIMARAKRREHNLAYSKLEEVILKMKEATVQEKLEGIDRLYSAVAAWGIYERRVREAPEWPYNANILRRLLMSVFVPCIVYLIKILFNLRIGL